MLNRILLTTDTVGGVWRYSLELARGLAQRDVGIVMAVLGPPPAAEQRREAAAIPAMRLIVTDLPLDWLAKTIDQIESTSEALAAMARQVDADTVHLHAPALVGHAQWPVPVIAAAHSCVGTWWQAVYGGVLPSDLEWRAEATKVGIERASVVIAPSQSFAEALRACYGVGRPITVVLNGTTPVVAKADRLQQALTVGRLWDEGKNIAALDAAAEALQWPVQAAGSARGPDGTLITCRHLRMLGVLDGDALATAYAKASIFVSIALYEPFGLAVLEAAHAGCALVLSDIPTFRELWDGAAVFVPSDSAGQVAEVLNDLVRHPDVLADQGRLASRRAALFSPQYMTDATWTLHEQVSNRTRTAA